MRQPKAISGLTSAAAARVMLWQSGEPVTVPGGAMGLLTTDSVSAYMLTLLNDADAIAARATLGLAWEHISTQTPSGVASVDWTNLGAFRELRLSGWARPATDAVSAMIRTDANNGASFDAGASDYALQRTWNISTVMTSVAASNTSFQLNAGNTIGNVAPESIWFTVQFDRFNEAAVTAVLYDVGWLNGSTVLAALTGIGYRNDATARNAIQFLFTSGNVAAGRLVLEGIRG